MCFRYSRVIFNRFIKNVLLAPLLTIEYIFLPSGNASLYNMGYFSGLSWSCYPPTPHFSPSPHLAILGLFLALHSFLLVVLGGPYGVLDWTWVCHIEAIALPAVFSGSTYFCFIFNCFFLGKGSFEVFSTFKKALQY